ETTHPSPSPHCMMAPKNFCFLNVEFKAQAGPLCPDYIYGFRNLFSVSDNCTIIQIPSMEKKLAAIPDPMNKWVQTRAKRRGPKGSPC
ncbi:hypothetical protein Tco_0264141, partial [Tanacetum coccineum]